MKKRILSLLLCLVMALSLIPAMAFAQECAWTLYVDGVKYSSSASYVQNGTLTYNGSTVKLNNFYGKKIEAIPGGSYGNDDAPCLNIELNGTNYLSGGVLGDGTYGALYAEKRYGGYGADSEIRISGNGTLNMTKYTYGTPSEAYDYNAISAGYCRMMGSCTVNIDYNVLGLNHEYYLKGVACDLTVTDGAVAKIHLNASDAYASQYSTTPIHSSCPAYGVDGDLTVSANDGYVSIDMPMERNNSSYIYCVRGNVNMEGSTSSLYMRYKHCSDPTKEWININNDNYVRRSVQKSDADYYALIPMMGAETNDALRAVDITKVEDLLFFGQEQEMIPDFWDDYSDKYVSYGFYPRVTYSNIDLETGQDWQQDDYFDYETYPGYDAIIRGYVSLIPAPGYYIPKDREAVMISHMCDTTGFAPDVVFSNWSGAGVTYMYAMPEITQQPTAKNIEVKVKPVRFEEEYDRPVVYEPDVNYEWYLTVYANGTHADFLVDEFGGDMDGFEDLDTNKPRLGFDDYYMDYEVPVGGKNVKLGDASGLKLSCKVSTIAGSVWSNAINYWPFSKVPATPAAPTLSIAKADGKIKLSWNDGGATKYWIYRSTDGTNFKYYDTTTKTSYTNSSVTSGTKYYYKVKAVATINGKDYISAYSAVKSTIPLTTPTLSISKSDGKIKLSWNAVTGATKYWIYRSTDGTNFKYYDTTTKTSYTNSSVTSGTKYYYKVKAVKNVNGTDWVSSYSAVKSTVPLKTPTLSATVSSGKVKLSWGSVTGATKYWIYRSTDGKTFKYYDSTTNTSYTNSSVTAGKTYYYKIKAAKNINGTDWASDYSNVVSKKP